MDKFYSLIMENFNVVIFVICFCIGYVVKNSKVCSKINNSDIPLIMVVLGIILGVLQCVLMKQPFTLDCIAMGAFSGLLSTSAYELYKSFVKKFNKDYGLDNPEENDIVD